MRIHPVERTVETASGTASFNTVTLIGGVCRMVYIKAATDGTVFSASVTDAKNREVLNYAAERTPIIDITNHIPVRGVYTVEISGADADQEFDCLMMIEE